MPAPLSRWQDDIVVGAPPSHHTVGTPAAGRSAPHPRVTPVETIWLLIALLVPLAVNPWGNHPFDLTKSLILRALVWLGVALWLTLRPKRSQALPSTVRWTAVCLAGAWLLTTLTGVSPLLSFWGSSERGQGAITLLTGLLLFILVATRLRGHVQAWQLIRILTLTTAPIVLLILLEKQGWTLVQPPGAGAIELSSTLGQPGAVGVYLALLLPLTAAMAVHLDHGWQCRAVCGLSMAALGVVGLTLAQEAWLAAAVGLAAFGGLLVWPRLSRRLQRAGVTVVGLALLAAVASLVWSGTQSTDARTAGILATRWPIWEATWTLIRQRPVLGYGPETLELVFPSVYPAALAAGGAHSLLVDRAHNWPLDTWVASGLPGLLAWSSFVLACLATGWRALQRSEHRGQRLLLASSMAAVIGNLVGTLFAASSTATTTVIWLLLALIVAIAQPVGAPPPHPLPGLTRPALRAGILALTLFIIAETAARPLLADIAMNRANRQARAGLWDVAAATAGRGVRLWPVELSSYLDASWICVLRSQRGSGTAPCLEHGEDYLLQARELWPGSYRVHAGLGELYATWAVLYDPDRFPQADAAYAMATRLAPNLVSLHMSWGMVYAQMEQWTGAARELRQAVALDPATNNVYLRLGEAELALGNVEAAIAAYQEALRWKPDQAAAFLGLSHCYEALGQPEVAAEWRERALEQ